MADSMSTAEISTNGINVAIKTDTVKEKIIHPLIEPNRITESMPQLTSTLNAYPFLNTEHGILPRLYNHHPASYNHSLRTGIGLEQLGRELGLSESDRILLVAAGLAHDGGKAETDLGVLDFKGPLGERRPVMEAHLLKGVAMIPDEHRDMKTIIAGHHIADGYLQYQHLWQTNDPRIKVFQTLVSAVERTDAVMTSERKYRDSATKPEALAMMLERGFDKRFAELGLDVHLIGRIVDIQQAVIDTYPSQITFI